MERQIKTARGYHYASISRAKMKRQNQMLAITNASEGAEKWNFYTLLLQHGTATLKNRWQFLRKVNIFLLCSLAIFHPTIDPNETKTHGFICNCQNCPSAGSDKGTVVCVFTQRNTAHNEKRWILMQAAQVNRSTMLSDSASMTAGKGLTHRNRKGVCPPKTPGIPLCVDYDDGDMTIYIS